MVESVPIAPSPSGVDGGVVSGATSVVAVAGALSAEALFDVSNARTVYVWVDAGVSPLSLKLGCPTLATSAPSRYTS